MMSKFTGTGSVPDVFPAGLRVLVVDDDRTCLMAIKKMLTTCNYEVTVCDKAEIGLVLLRENKNGFDIVLCDVHMPGMDGFNLLEQIRLEMDLPVIMMSVDANQSLVMKGVTQGACDYIIKPVRMEVLRNIWQHVVRRQKNKLKVQVPEDVEYSSSGTEGHNWKNANRRKYYDDDSDERESSSKKPRVVWTVELHQQFVAAVQKIGIDKAVPKNILATMNVPGLTRENIASHLQKYRMYLKRVNEPQYPGSIDTSFMSMIDSGYDPRALSVRRQLPGQSLATVLGGSYNSRSQHLLHGISTNMESSQLMNLHQPYNYQFNNLNSQVSQVVMPISGQSQHVFPNGSNVSGGRIVPSFNLLNQIKPDSSFSQDMTLSNLFATPFAFNDESGTRSNGNMHNQDDLLAAILKQPQEGFGQVNNEFGFDGYDLDDLPGSF